MRFRVLGPVGAHTERGTVDVGPARQRAVLAVLLVKAGGPVSVDQLVDRVWGEAPPQRARQTLHTYLSRLRTVLGDAGGPVLTRRGGGYVLEMDESAVDLHRFRVLAAQARRAGDDESAAGLWQEALGLWRGRPFADVDNDWLRQVAAEWEGERLAAVLDRTDVLLRRGEHARLLPELTALVGEHPLDERLVGQLMVALYRCGRQADALAQYRTLRSRLVQELGSDPGPALRQLHQQVLCQDPQLGATTGGGTSQPLVAEVAEPRPAGSADPASRPAQLPADVAGFTGRAADLRRLDELVSDATDGPQPVVITAIGGTAGVGKTALAVHWAHRIAGRFPDGQLYLNLRGYDPTGQVMRPAEALRALMELLQIPSERIPTSMEAQAGLYRSHLAGARMLVVLDNARDADQVRPLLPGSPGCMVLVTSRDQLAGLVAAEGARPVRLDVLDDTEAAALLVARLGAQRVAAEPDAVAAVIKACAGLPLALAIVAARAAMQPRFPLQTFAGELANARDRLDALATPDTAIDIRAVFSWSYDRLRPPAARLFRLLGLHPGPDIGLPAAASLAGLPVAPTRRLLGELINAHLLTEHAPGRFGFHDLLRAYATERAHATDPEPDRRDARRRMHDYYLHAAYAADRCLPVSRDPIDLKPPEPGVVTQRYADPAEARGWLTAELPVLLRVVDQAIDAGFDRHVQHLAFVLVPSSLLWRGLWHEQLSVLRAGLAAAHRRGDRAGQPYFHWRLAQTHLHRGQHDEARPHLERALALGGEIGDHVSLGRAHIVLAWLSESEGRYRDSLRHSQQCLAAARAAGNPGLRAMARNALGWSYYLLGDYQRAVEHGEQALAELAELGQLTGVGDVLHTLGHAHRQAGHHSQAIDYFQQAVDRNRELGDHRQEASSLTDLGDAYDMVGESIAASGAWQQALAIFDDIADPRADELRKRLEPSKSTRLGHDLHE